MRRLLLVFALVIPALPARAGSGTAPPAFAIANIYNGTATPGFPAIVGLGLLNRDGTGAGCSGTLIAPTVVLTAAHCLAFGPVDGFAAVFADGTTRTDYPAVAFIPHPEFDFFRPAVADVGVVILGTPVTDVAPLPLAERAPRPGRTGEIVGFGDDGLGDSGRKRVGTVRVRRCPRLVRVRNGTVRLGKSLCWRAKGGSDTCSGDSGGPLLVDGRVAGVTSGGIGTGGCPSVLSYDTNVARYRPWIVSVLP